MSTNYILKSKLQKYSCHWICNVDVKIINWICNWLKSIFQ